MSPQVLRFEDVYRTNVQFVWRSLRRLGVPDSDVFDAAQEVFVAVSRKLPEFEQRSKITRWLFSFCMHVAADRRKSARVRYEQLDEAAGADCAAQGPGADEQIDRQRAFGQLQWVLQQMPMEQRAVFILFELEGMTGSEIADMLQTPLPTVHSRLRLAREEFRRFAARFQASDKIVARMGGEA